MNFLGADCADFGCRQGKRQCSGPGMNFLGADRDKDSAAGRERILGADRDKDSAAGPE